MDRTEKRKRGGCGVLLAGTRSGSGKTTLTLGVMAALVRGGSVVQPFKCGPDFIDPTLHRLVTGRISRNLDLWMCGRPYVEECFASHGAGTDLAVVEGVMGLFDGGEASSAALAKALGLPVVLVVDVRSAAESVAAVVYGFEKVDPEVSVAGVILNRVGSERHLTLLRAAIEKHCRAEILGHLPRETAFAIPDRHLGLHMGEENPLTPEAVDRLAASVAAHIDLDRLVELAAGTPRPAKSPTSPGKAKVEARIGVARDRAFCFYYEDNFDLLRSAGAELVFFSPLVDKKLPAGLDGIYLGGGYPELHARHLAANGAMRREIREWAEAGRPLYAECGGFMYLTEGIVDAQERLQPMAGVFPVTAMMQKRLAGLGYREVTLREGCMLGPAGTRLRGHEFHYSAIGEMPARIRRLYDLGNGTHEGFRYKNTLGGYLHVHFGSQPRAAADFVRFARGEQWT